MDPADLESVLQFQRDTAAALVDVRLGIDVGTTDLGLCLNGRDPDTGRLVIINWDVANMLTAVAVPRAATAGADAVAETSAMGGDADSDGDDPPDTEKAAVNCNDLDNAEVAEMTARWWTSAEAALWLPPALNAVCIEDQPKPSVFMGAGKPGFGGAGSGMSYRNIAVQCAAVVASAVNC